MGVQSTSKTIKLNFMSLDHQASQDVVDMLLDLSTNMKEVEHSYWFIDRIHQGGYKYCTQKNEIEAHHPSYNHCDR